MIEIDIGPNLYSAGSWGISWDGLFTFAAVAMAIYLVVRWAPLKRLNPDDIYTLAICAIVVGVIGARLVHVIDNWGELYQSNPVRVLYIWEGGIALWGGILGGLAGGSAYALIRKLPLGVILDTAAPAVLLAQVIGRLGDIVSGEQCAQATRLIFGFEWTGSGSLAQDCASGYGSGVHPAIAYEMIWSLLALAVIWTLRGRLRPDGMLFALYLALYAVGGFAISFARDERIWALGMGEAHYIALLVLLVTVSLLAVRARPTARVIEAPVRVEYGTRAERRRRARAQRK